MEQLVIRLTKFHNDPDVSEHGNVVWVSENHCGIAIDGFDNLSFIHVHLKGKSTVETNLATIINGRHATDKRIDDIVVTAERGNSKAPFKVVGFKIFEPVDVEPKPVIVYDPKAYEDIKNYGIF
jgi:hypothetical protein